MLQGLIARKDVKHLIHSSQVSIGMKSDISFILFYQNWQIAKE